MARVTHTNHAKCTIWTPQMKADISGPRLACAIELFRSLEIENMPIAIKKMQEIFDRRVEAQGERNAAT